MTSEFKSYRIFREFYIDSTEYFNEYLGEHFVLRDEFSDILGDITEAHVINFIDNELPEEICKDVVIFDIHLEDYFPEGYECHLSITCQLGLEFDSKKQFNTFKIKSPKMYQFLNTHDTEKY